MSRIRLLALALGAILLPGIASAQNTDSRPGLAVFPFTNGGSFGADAEDLDALQVGIQQMLLTELSQNPQLRIVERSQLRAILDEQNLVREGAVDPNTAARIGQLVGARYIVTGVFMDIGGDFRMDGRIVNVETGEIMRTVEVRDQRDNLYQLLVDLSGSIMEGVSLPPLATAVVQERRARAIPAEAVTLFSRAQVYQDGGRDTQAIELYRQIAERFPEMTEAREALQQLTGV